MFEVVNGVYHERRERIEPATGATAERMVKRLNELADHPVGHAVRRRPRTVQPRPRRPAGADPPVPVPRGGGPLPRAAPASLPPSCDEAASVVIELPSPGPSALARWFPGGAPGLAALPEHVIATGGGRWWADRAVAPKAVAVSSGDHLLLRGDPGALNPDALARFAGSYVEAPARFLPFLGAAFQRIDPWERMVYVRSAAATGARPAHGVTVRRLTPGDAPAVVALGPGAAWIHRTWGGPERLASSGLCWGAFHRGRALSLACTYFLGSRYEDVAALAALGHRRQHLALACVSALCQDIEARGRTASWTCSRDNRPSRLLAWSAGFRLTREYVHYATGPARIPALHKPQAA
ncbi:GNAT family N-acetyltransferase [Streptomyces sp. NPDC001373]|uniref:GNAT family N-acetyltransferase n=1 Tax=Streptomyces sp. NPDC001373 TaxID=3364565 RepID=UPI00368DF64D